MARFDMARRTEMLMRHVRDSSVHQAMADADKADITLRDMQRRVDLAVSNALVQFAAMIQIEINRIEADEERRMDDYMMRSPSLVIKDFEK